MDHPNFTGDYDVLLDPVRTRVIDYLSKLREKTVPVHSHSYTGRPPADNNS
jgi:hypothetical protein